MKIKFVGQGTRIYGAHRWDAENHYTVEVDAATALELLTYPRAQFVVAEGDDLATMTGDDLAVYLMAGIGSLAELAKLEIPPGNTPGAYGKDVAALAEKSGMGADSITERVKAARNLLKEA